MLKKYYTTEGIEYGKKEKRGGITITGPRGHRSPRDEFQLLRIPRRRN